MSLGMFALGGLELLGVLEEVVSEVDRKAWIEWVYSQQRVPAEKDVENEESGTSLDWRIVIALYTGTRKKRLNSPYYRSKCRAVRLWRRPFLRSGLPGSGQWPC